MEQILFTKLSAPPKRKNIVRRPHLTKKLQSNADFPGNFTLLSGPAGFGKTTLLTDFLSANNRATAWISLDHTDNDSIQFWTYFIHACQSIDTSIGQTTLDLCKTQPKLPDSLLLTPLINDLVKSDKEFILIVDDLHEIQSMDIHTGLIFLLNNLPDNINLVFSTRIDPPWPIAKYRARNRILEIRSQELRFSGEETRSFLSQFTGFSLSSEDIASLEEKTEGWIAGLQLTALSLQGRDDISTFINEFRGSHIYIADYLIEEVLQRQSRVIQDFLLKTSILSQLNAGLCEELTGCQDSQQTLQTLLKENIFIVALDSENRWFRYHRLFADLLNTRLSHYFSDDQINELHLLAARWFAKNNLVGEAVRHAIAGKAYEYAAELIGAEARKMIFTGRLSTLERWFSSLPQPVFQKHSRLVFLKYWHDILQNTADVSKPAIAEIENKLQTLPRNADSNQLRGEVMAAICRAVTLSGRIMEGMRLAKDALSFLPEDDFAARATVNSALASAYDLSGKANEAAPHYNECISLALKVNNHRLAAHTLMAKGLVHLHNGDLSKAEYTFQQIIDIKKDVPYYFYPEGQGMIGLGCVQLERGNYETAEDLLQQGIKLCSEGGLDGPFVGHTHLSRLYLILGDYERAMQEVQQLKGTSQRVDEFNIINRMIQIKIATEQLDDAMKLADALKKAIDPQQPVQPPLLFFEMIQSVLIRTYIATGCFDEAHQLLEDLQTTAQNGHRTRRLVDISIYKTLIHSDQETPESSNHAMNNLSIALELAAEEGIVSPFLVERKSLLPFLEKIKNQSGFSQSAKEHARKILDKANQLNQTPIKSTSTNQSGFIEDLTDREMEVLNLIAMGDSNQAIAEKLFITVRTVKKHTGNIYGKLEANSRTQAVARAIELGIIIIE